jgi:hypothetical protein
MMMTKTMSLTRMTSWITAGWMNPRKKKSMKRMSLITMMKMMMRTR